MTTMTRPRATQVTARNWGRYSACVPHDPELWYVDGTGKSAAYDDLTEAKRICGTCPVADWCLDSTMAAERSMAAESRHGIRAGMTPTERHQLYRRSVRGG